MKSFEELIEDFKKYSIESKKEVDNLDKNQIKLHNKNVDNYRKIAKIINDKFQDRIEDFVKLLKEENDIKISCAVCIIDLIKDNEKYKDRAKTAIQEYIDDVKTGPNVVGLKVYLQNIK